MWFLVFGLFTANAMAVDLNDIQFQELNLKDGLSDNTILDIAEDNKGYLWFATMNGLNRYSGYSIKQYYPSDVDQNSLPSGLVRSLHVDSKGNLWAGTFEGLARYQPETDNFKVYHKANSALRSNFIQVVTSTYDGNLLLADNSYLYTVNIDTGELTLFTETRIPSHTQTLMAEKNRIWVGTAKQGGHIYSKNEDILYPLAEVNPWSFQLNAASLFDIKVINGKYWLGTDTGLHIFSVDDTAPLTIDNRLLGSVSTPKVRTIEQREDSVWLGTDQGLFFVPDQIELSSESVSGSITSVNSEFSHLTGLTQQFIPRIVEDSTGSVWIGTFQGVFRYHPRLNAVKLHTNQREFQEIKSGATVWGLAQDQRSNIWFAMQKEGLGKYDKSSGSTTYFPPLTHEDGEQTYWDIVIDQYDKIWVASSNGLHIFSHSENEISHEKTLFKGTFIDYLYFDGQQIWLWTDSGLKSIRPSLLKNYAQTGDSNQFLMSHPLPEGEGIFIPLYKDENNRLWLKQQTGISIYSPQKRTIVKSLTEQDGVKSLPVNVYETAKNYWLTTRSDGVLRLNKRTLKVEQKQRREKNNGFIYLSEGAGDFVWYADNAGIHRVDLSRLEISETYSPEQLEFNALNESAVIRLDNGELVFGGSKGFNRVSTEVEIVASQRDEQTRKPDLFEFTVFGERNALTSDLTNHNDDQTLTTKTTSNITYDSVRKIDYDESRFSISFGLINALFPSAVSYRYRLAGYDDRWTLSDNSRTAQFNNITFGHYTFEVQAKASAQQWSDSRTLAINIGRPPWLHSVALGFYALLMTIVLIYIIRQYQMRKTNQQAIKESEERLKLTLWSSGDELWDWDVYRGQVYRANTWGTMDFPQDSIRTTGAYEANIHPYDIVRVQETLREHLEGKTDFYELAYRAKTFKNQWIWLLDRGKVVQRDHNQQPVRMTGTLKNIHHLKEAEEQLNLFKRSIENISEGVFITNTQFKFISVNNAYCRYTGETREQSLASYLYFHQYPEAFTQEIKKTLKTKGNWSGEVESARVNGERYEMELNIDAVHDEDGKISHFVGVFSDITSRKNTEKELLKLANTDPLTDLPNRSFFQASHQNLVRKSIPHTLMCLDMDNFKKINDSLGHQTGDILIKQIAKRLQRITGNNATCYRLGGDEFSVLMEEYSDIHTITHYAQSILDNLSRPFVINKQEFVLGASVGIAFYPEDGTSPQEMLKNADTAMYFAKNNGGNSYQFFSGEMNQNAVRQLQIENLIRQGIKDDLFTVYYQPKVDITTGKLVSMEALVRFEHPHKGVVSPGQFIPLAEQTGQIIEIGEQVLRKACADTKRWVNAGLFTGRVAVNISGKQFELPDLDERILKVLNEVGLSPLHLECEITEGTLMESPDAGLQMMQRLRERGIHLALDDFGTGYSSLAYLKRFPLNTLKIDKAFIDDIAHSNVDRHMAAAIINIAHNLGLKVVAEGVEYEEQLTILRSYDCEMLQGFLYSRPITAERFERLLGENHKLHNLMGQKSL
ncbi:diguanylate cyclase [Alteromonas halophila]|uniref:Diguanylate cyclase n=2 Tax=Alteromonas halophila TaxID=516698 RepID=A0A918JD22_9ALTE|nr:diguanylate cyclase [Alteromonas halophila]